MVSRRQFMLDGVAVTLTPGFGNEANKVTSEGVSVVQLAALQHLHPDVLQGLRDRIGDILPSPLTALVGNADGNGFFTQHTAFSQSLHQTGTWRFLPNVDDLGGRALGGAVAFCCDRLSRHLDALAVLRFGQGCSFAGLTVLHYNGIETSIVLILQSARYGFRPDALLLNA